ncbi:MAG: haloacid dehalogenase type II [Actinomycetota bacterium]|nr:MAG: haloacid dehalogenase type II [Actinomycetota bacterium]
MNTRAHRPKAVAFDVNETLFDISRLSEVFDGFGLPSISISWWFAMVLRDGIALAASGDSAPFGMVAGSAFEELFASLGMNTPTGAVSVLLETFASLPAHPDVVSAFELLKEAGIPALALTNGNANVTRGLIERAGVSHLVSQVLSVDEVAHWKPRPEPYLYAAKQSGVSPDSLALVAVHPWDTHGAKRAGLVAGWLNRNHRHFPAYFTAPDVEASTLDGVIRLLLQLR